MWDLLQQNCLLEQEARLGTGPRKESALARRLRQAREAAEGKAKPPIPKVDPEPAIDLKQDTQVRRPEPIVTSLTPVEPELVAPSPRIEPDYVTPSAQPPISHPSKRDPGSTAPFVTAENISTVSKKEPLCDLIIVNTGRLVNLPLEGVIVLGRFEYGVGEPPDVDLTYDDRDTQTVSLRHACVICKSGRRWIEDLGSTSGTFLNSRQLTMGKKEALSQGDQILLGQCRLLYELRPGWAANPDPHMPRVSLLTISNTGYQFELAPQGELVLGRPDPNAGHIPDIDLSLAGKIANHVSRRHARLAWRNGWHFVEDMGSSAGTRVNGQAIKTGDAPLRLHPGDQLWLGGCVLAYEWELR